MKIVLVGATGTIGKHVANALQSDHQIVRVGGRSGDFQVDMSDITSIQQLFKQIGSFDALVCTAGDARFVTLPAMTDADFQVGLKSKLMGQINMVLIGQKYISPKGSFTLTSGSLADDPVVAAASVSAINGAVNGFVKAAAIELEHGVRINAVAPTVVVESPQYLPFFPGTIPVSMHRVAQAYVKSVLGAQTGQVYRVF